MDRSIIVSFQGKQFVGSVNGALEEKTLLLRDHDAHSQMARLENIRHFWINHPEIEVALSDFVLQ